MERLKIRFFFQVKINFMQIEDLDMNNKFLEENEG